MTPERERWAEAATILRLYGDDAPRFIATRIGLLIKKGDQAGIDRMKEIAARVDALMRPGPTTQEWRTLLNDASARTRLN